MKELTQNEKILNHLRVHSEWPRRSQDVMKEGTLGENGRVCDWRNYIPDSVRFIWHMMTERERRIAMLTAHVATDQEDWSY